MCVTALAVLPSGAEDIERAAQLALQLDLPVLAPDARASEHDEFAAVLKVQGARLMLQRTGPNPPGPISVDFGSPAMRHRRRSGANELLGRAVGVGKKADLRILDATAGLGRDSFVLADSGCIVTLYERHPVIAQLLGAGLDAARSGSDSWLQSVASRMRLFNADARDYFSGGSGLAPVGAPTTALSGALPTVKPVDVIYLDPMFPPRGKSAAVGKEMALLQLLLHDGESMEAAKEAEARALLEWACGANVARVVVKRPVRAPSLAQSAPSHCIRGKAVRYDVYVLASLTHE